MIISTQLTSPNQWPSESEIYVRLASPAFGIRPTPAVRKAHLSTALIHLIHDFKCALLPQISTTTLCGRLQ